MIQLQLKCQISINICDEYESNTIAGIMQYNYLYMHMYKFISVCSVLVQNLIKTDAENIYQAKEHAPMKERVLPFQKTREYRVKERLWYAIDFQVSTLFKHCFNVLLYVHSVTCVLRWKWARESHGRCIWCSSPLYLNTFISLRAGIAFRNHKQFIHL